MSGFVQLRLPYSTYVVELQVHLKHCDGFKLRIEEVSVARRSRTTHDERHLDTLWLLIVQPTIEAVVLAEEQIVEVGAIGSHIFGNR